MTQSPNKKSQTTQRPPTNAAILLFKTALDTTWRIFIPAIGGTFVGIGIDNWLHIAPIATIILMIVGVAVSVLLVAKQLRDVRKSLV